MIIGDDGHCFGIHGEKIIHKRLDPASEFSTVADAVAASGTGEKIVDCKDVLRLYVEADVRVINVVGKDKLRIMRAVMQTPEDVLQVVSTMRALPNRWSCRQHRGYFYNLFVGPGLAGTAMAFITMLMWPTDKQANFVGRKQRMGEAFRAVGEFIGTAGVTLLAVVSAVVVIGWTVKVLQRPERSFTLKPR